MEKNKARSRFIVLCVAPAVILFVIFMIIPTLNVFRMSLFERGAYSPTETFVGFENFKALTNDTYFIRAMQNTILLIVVVTMITFALALLFAGILTRENIKGKELRFNTEEVRVVFLIKFLSRTEVLPFNMVQQIFPDKNKDYVISISEQDIVVVKEIKGGTDIREIEKLARSIADTLGTEFYAKVAIGIGTAVDNIKDLARSYKEAQTAIEVGKVFDTEKTVISYENLGIGRLIYQLPTTLCEMFLQEVFKYGSLESLDHETLMTIQCFFENNLNVSETSRKLFVHRNTLVYRLEKIRKLTGLDLREFDNAITLKVALMVKRYLTTKPVKF